MNAVLQSGENKLDRSCEKLSIYVVKVERNITQTVKIRKANRIGHILHRLCLLEHVAEGKIEGVIEGMVRRRRRRKQLLDDLNEKSGYCKLKEEARDRSAKRTRLGRGCGLGVRLRNEMYE